MKRGGTGVHGGLLIAWVALIAADRIDLLGGGGAFLLTPFIALTPFVVGSELLRRHLQRLPVSISRQGAWFSLLSLSLIAVVVASVFVSPETATSASRAVQLAMQIAGAFAVILVASDRTDFASLLDRGAVIGLLLFALFNVLQIAFLFGAVPETVHLGPASVHLIAYTYGAFIPRLSGMVADQNRAGLVLLLYAWFVARRPAGPRSGYLALTAILMLLTLSRSVLLAGLATFVILVLEGRVRRVARGYLFGAMLLAAGVSGVLLLSPAARALAGSALDPLAGRLSVAEGSSQVHLTVIERGLDEATKTLPRVAIGLGYGSSYTVLQDVFPGSRYGNFHSLYVTMFAEAGVFALLIAVLMMGVPLARGGPYRALVGGVAVFNIFYQVTADPGFWAVLALAWLTMPPIAPAARRAGAIRAS